MNLWSTGNNTWTNYPNLNPKSLSFLSLGKGSRQHNMGKVYGLYECAGHVVPCLVIVKVGKPTECARPGNCGKCELQIVMTHFLNKVYFNSPMNPMELEMYHQIKNAIGVNPTFYESLFTVNANTAVELLSVNCLISTSFCRMIHNKKVLGICGKTELTNAKKSIITMMQYTCTNYVDTLHMKNLLLLGENCYLITLLLKHYPLPKAQMIRNAHAYTVAPSDWKTLLSQHD
ncbi:glycosyltransferase family 2 protein [Serpula lacrymans var. lacrymans S7.3]|uniref:Glycosyltransferase family 2 protein n=1 Tax=Serpula lacrymans var. lacrymans (strain S7.3) TaxID=936435 RepID=F8PFY7_SERL3|nr:glycosyltransferase family 2 protein [Serpula lacrymans var. lacrymans S7.3]